MHAKAETNVVPLPTSAPESKAPAPRTFEISPLSLRAAMNAALLTVCKDETRAHLNAIALMQRDGWIELVSTDGHRLTSARTFARAPGKDCRALALWNPDSVKIAASALKSSPKRWAQAGGKVELVLHDDGSAEVAGVKIAATGVPPSQYPPIEQVIPTFPAPASKKDAVACPITIGANPKYMRDAMRAAMIYASDTRGARMRFSGDELAPFAVCAEDPDVGELLVVVMPMRL